MDALLIANPNASTTDPRVIADVAAVIDQHHQLEVRQTKQRHHAIEIAADAVESGVQLVASLGGDGTANEILQSLAGTEALMAVLPGGGANVFARTLGLPEDPVEAARALLPTHRDPTTRRIGLGRANGRWFAISAGLGFDASVVEAVERHDRLKRLLRDAAFVALGLTEWFASTDRHEVPIDVELPDGSVHTGNWVVVASNSDPFTYLGALPMRLTPGVDFDDGIAVLAVGPASTGHVLRLVTRVFAGSRHLEDPAVRTFHDLDRLVIRADGPRPFQVDGDAAGSTDRLEIVRCPHALSVLVAG